MCIARVLKRSFGTEDTKHFSPHAMPFLMIFPPRRFHVPMLCARCSFVGKSAINIECHVGCYDVLIDCLTTNRLEAISTKREAFEDGNTFDALPRGFSL